MEEKKFDKDINVSSKDDADINVGMTDEEIKSIRYDLVLQKGVAGLDGFASVPHSKLVKWLDLIERLQSENAEQKAEIERLKAEKNDWKQRYDSESQKYADLCNASSECTAKKNDRIAELQKQVDKLNDLQFTQEHCDLYSENEFLKASLQKQKEERENMQAEIIATEEARLQAVKDTAKAIYSLMVGEYECYIPPEIAKEIVLRYGLEVE